MNPNDRPKHADEAYMVQLTKWLAANHLESIDYWPETPGVCQLADISNLLISHRRSGGAAPKILLVGTFELSNIRAIAWSGGQFIPDPPRLKGLARQRYLDAPIQIPFFSGLTVYPLKTFSCFRLY